MAFPVSSTACLVNKSDENDENLPLKEYITLTARYPVDTYHKTTNPSDSFFETQGTNSRKSEPNINGDNITCIRGVLSRRFFSEK